MRIGVFGGSFNPIHKGHIGLSECFVSEGLVDEVWLMVSPHNPLKRSDGLLPEEERFRLAQLATSNVSGVVVSDFEFTLSRPSFTYNTLLRLREAYPQHQFTLIIGADNWQVFSKWRNHEAILAEHDILVYPREGCTIDARLLPERVSLVDAPQFPFSSTMIREQLKQGTCSTEALPEAVLNEILEKGYYL